MLVCARQRPNRQRPNLQVIIDAQALRVLLDGYRAQNRIRSSVRLKMASSTPFSIARSKFHRPNTTFASPPERIRRHAISFLARMCPRSAAFSSSVQPSCSENTSRIGRLPRASLTNKLRQGHS